MAEVVAINLKVDGGNSYKQIKKLEDGISDLIDETNELNETNIQFKKELQELTNTYNELPKSQLAARSQVKKQMEELKFAIKDNNIALQEFRIKKQQKQKMVNDLKGVQKEAKKTAQELGNIAEGVGHGYKAFLGVTTALGGSNDELIEAYVKLESITKGLEGVEKLRKMGLKDSAFLTSALSVKTKVLTGIQKAYAFAVNLGSKSMKSFKGALISTGIGALVVLIGTIIAKWDDWKDTIMKFINTALSPVMWLLEKLGIIDDETERIRKKNHETHMKRLEKEKSELESQAEVRDKRLNHEIALAQARGENSEEIEEKLLQHQVDSNKAILLKQEDKYREMLKNTQKYSFEELKEQSKLNNKLRGEIQVHERNLKVFNEKAETEKRRERQKNWEKRKKEKQKEFEEELQMLRDKMQKELDLEEEMQDLIIENMQDEDAKKLAQLQLQQERELATLRDKYGMETELEIELLKKQATELNEAKKQIAEDNLEELRKAREEEDIFADEERELNLEKFEDYQLSELEILKARFDAGLITEEKYNEGVAKLEKEKEDLRKAGFAAASSIFNSLATLTDGNEKAQKGFLAVQKAITLAQIGVDTAKAISSLTANSQGNPANSVTFGAAGAIQFATGLAQILSNVAQAKKLLSGGSGVSAPSVPSAPSFNNNIPTTVTSGTAPTGNNTGGRTEIPTTKVVLVESELQAMQSRRMQVDTIATI